MSSDADRQTYLRNAELRAEIVYSVGGDPTRYTENVGLQKADVVRIARQLQPDGNDLDVEALRLGDLYDAVCEWAGGEYSPNAGNPWKINRENLKQIHRAVEAESPTKVVEYV